MNIYFNLYSVDIINSIIFSIVCLLHTGVQTQAGGSGGRDQS